MIHSVSMPNIVIKGMAASIFKKIDAKLKVFIKF